MLIAIHRITNISANVWLTLQWTNVVLLLLSGICSVRIVRTNVAIGQHTAIRRSACNCIAAVLALLLIVRSAIPVLLLLLLVLLLHPTVVVAGEVPYSESTEGCVIDNEPFEILGSLKTEKSLVRGHFLEDHSLSFE